MKAWQEAVNLLQQAAEKAEEISWKDLSEAEAMEASESLLDVYQSLEFILCYAIPE